VKQRSLLRRIVLSMLLFAALVAAATTMFGFWLQDDLEQEAWHSVLNEELDSWLARREREPDTSGAVRAFTADTLPAPFAHLGPGVNDDVEWQGRNYAVLVRGTGAARVAIALDISHMESDQRSAKWGFVLLLSMLVLALAVALHLLATRAVAPIDDLARRLDALEPGARARIASPYREAEIAAITAAVNRFLERIDGFVEREREFVDSASHELRTPIAVIGGAVDVLDARIDLPDAAHAPLLRIRESVADMADTASAMLFLTREAGADAAQAETLRLDEVLAERCAVHARDREAGAIQISPLPPIVLRAPRRMLVIALDNLLRNALAHGTGAVAASLADGVVRIAAPSGLRDPAEVGRLYAAIARGQVPRPPGAGVGLLLLNRICERLGWRLSYAGDDEGRTVAELDLRSSVA